MSSVLRNPIEHTGTKRKHCFVLLFINCGNRTIETDIESDTSYKDPTKTGHSFLQSTYLRSNFTDPVPEGCLVIRPKQIQVCSLQ